MSTTQLYSVIELEQLQLDSEQLQIDSKQLRDITAWVKEFLAKPHPDLGRSGPVCPFLPRALKLNTISLAVIRTQHLKQSQIEAIVKQYRDLFLQLEPQSGESALYKSLLLVFPDVPEEEASTLIDEVQQKLKPFFVEEGLMLGEFHSRNQTPGLHNPHFRPLRSPVPMLAIRFMTESDLPFLHRSTDEPQLRMHYLDSYLKRLGTVIQDEKKLQEARRALVFAQIQFNQANQSEQKTSKCPFARMAKACQKLLFKFQLLQKKLFSFASLSFPF
jgi:hypothetical protein